MRTTTWKPHLLSRSLLLFSFLLASCGGGGTPSQPGNTGVPGGFSGVDLVPGNAFTGETREPPAYGTLLEQRAKAIARFDLVPFQEVSGPFEVGVVAFSGYGIDRVEFSADGSPWVAVKYPSLNPRTKVFEYWVTLKPEPTVSKRIEVRAIVYPNKGAPRLLTGAFVDYTKPTFNASSIYVSVKGNDKWPGSMEFPVQSLDKGLEIVADGGTVVITEPGEYPIKGRASSRKNDKWITVTRSASLSRDKVIVYGNALKSDVIRPMIHKVRWNGVTFDFKRISSYYPEIGDYVWFDDVRWYNPLGYRYRKQPFDMNPVRNADLKSYVTNSIAEDMAYGFTAFDLVRNCKVDKISSDAYQNSQLVLNSEAWRVDADAIPEYHTDVFQYFGTHENVIVYNFKAFRSKRAQGIFLDKTSSSFSNMAFVNVFMDLDQPNAKGGFSQLASKESHILFANVSLLDQKLIFRRDFQGASRFEPENLFFINCAFNSVGAMGSGSNAVPGVVFKNNHFVVPESSVGDYPTSGEIYHKIVGGDYVYGGAARNLLIGSGFYFKSLGASKPVPRGAFNPQ